MKDEEIPFWQAKSLAQLSREEWESLCDGCGKCCLIGLEDMDTGEVHLTDVACRLLDGQTCRCRDYPNRQSKVPDCVQLTPENVAQLHWLPKTCAYRLVSEGQPLRAWHPLLSGDAESVHRANVSVRGRTRTERKQKIRNLIRRITAWPEPDE